VPLPAVAFGAFGISERTWRDRPGAESDERLALIFGILNVAALACPRSMVSFVTITNGTIMPTASSIGYWCSIAAHQYFARLQQKLAHLDLTHWFYVLLTIEEGQGRLSQQELADRLDLDKVAMTRALDHLGDRGYIERCDCADDRRKYLVKLTPKARPAVRAIRKAYEELNEEALRGVSRSDRASFLEHLATMVDNLRPAEEPAPVTTKRVHA
jgi:DNA-binding MarR family transcriptional regulator